ncbi:MAG: UDP-N-acetylmuramate--L-alanine ligase [Candidatus Paceibacterota bacterium]|jgi:UDP-N-acetylmuramate--alanine ligase
MDIDLKAIKRIHFIGIGGIGISALARMMLLEGKEVTGSDRGESEVTRELLRAGIQVFIGHEARYIPENTDLVVYTIAIPSENPELVEAQRRGVPVVTYPELLGHVSAGKYTIAVSGTHGKTTTTAMIAKVMIDAGLEPTVVVGSMMRHPKNPEERTNFIPGTGKYFVMEACEYRRSFLNIQPTVLVVTNIDNDHLDYYKDIADIQSAFNEMARRLPADGFLVCNPDDSHIEQILHGIKGQVQNWSLYDTQKFSLHITGAHNRKNAQAVMAVADILGIPKALAQHSLEEFPGTWRRFEYKGKTATGALVYDDYGHHPTEVAATLQGAREKFGTKKIISVFQPHLYSRTRDLFEQFTQCFVDADEVVLAPIYAAREEDDGSISSKMLADAILFTGKKACSFHSFDEITDYVRAQVGENDVVLISGAGDIYKVAEKLVM